MQLHKQRKSLSTFVLELATVLAELRSAGYPSSAQRLRRYIIPFLTVDRQNKPVIPNFKHRDSELDVGVQQPVKAPSTIDREDPGLQPGLPQIPVPNEPGETDMWVVEPGAKSHLWSPRHIDFEKRFIRDITLMRPLRNRMQIG